MVRRYKTYTAAVLLGGMLLTCTLAIILPVTGRAGTIVRAGYPLAFLVQDQTRRDAPAVASAELLSPLEHPTSLHWPYLFVDVAVWSVLLALVIMLAKKLRGYRPQ
jgi:hypothetical protein